MPVRTLALVSLRSCQNERVGLINCGPDCDHAELLRTRPPLQPQQIYNRKHTCLLVMAQGLKLVWWYDSAHSNPLPQFHLK
ncbi:hypothetical protein HaLaN_30330, partial [Haematococcus lacustris]